MNKPAAIFGVSCVVLSVLLLGAIEERNVAVRRANIALPTAPVDTLTAEGAVLRERQPDARSQVSGMSYSEALTLRAEVVKARDRINAVTAERDEAIALAQRFKSERDKVSEWAVQAQAVLKQRTSPSPGFYSRLEAAGSTEFAAEAARERGEGPPPRQPEATTHIQRTSNTMTTNDGQVWIKAGSGWVRAR